MSEEPPKLLKARKARLDRLRKEGVKPIEFVCGNQFLAGTIWESRFDAMERQLNRKPSTKKPHLLKKLLLFLFP
jgi:hypothetical protein